MVPTGHLINVSDDTLSEIQINGVIGQAGLSRQTRAQQLTFVNGRAIESGLITAAVREGYHTALMKGQYPVTFLFLDLDPGAVDVNVHPTKREVRFRDPTSVREAIVRCIQQTLERGRTEWQENFARRSSAQRAPAPPIAHIRAAVDNSSYRSVEFNPRSLLSEPELSEARSSHIANWSTPEKAIKNG
jgi:DNA mismatch repair ATPase MutL